MTTDAQVEAAAKALHEAEYDADTYPFANESEFSQEQYRKAARAALAAAQAAGAPALSPPASAPESENTCPKCGASWSASDPNLPCPVCNG